MNNKYHVFRRSNSPNWYVWRYRGGQRLPKSTGLPLAQYTREQAQQLVDEWSGAGTAPDRITIAWLRDHVVDRMETEGRSQSTIRQYCNSFDYLEAIYGPLFDISNITRAAVWKIKEHGFLKGVTARTINTRLAYLHSAFNLLVKEDMLDRNPFAHFERVRAPGGEQGALTLDQLRRFINVLNTWPYEVARRLIRIILYTGLRRSEVLLLRREDIEVADEVPVRFHPQNVKRRDKRRRWLSIPRGAREDIAWFLDKYHGDYPFRQCHPDTLSDWAKQILCATGLPGFNTKSLRHTFSTRALEMGVSIRDLQRYLDHSDVRVTEIYAHDIDRQDLEIDIGI